MARKKSSKSKSAYVMPYKRPASKPRDPFPKRRTGSGPDIHDKISTRIQFGKTLRSMAKTVLTAAARKAIHQIQKPETMLVPALWKVAKSKLITGLAPAAGTSDKVGVGFRPSSLTERIHPPTQRNLVDNKTYHTKIDLHEGEPSRIITSAKERYPSSSEFVWKTGAAYCADMIFQCHGINQTGFWQPYSPAAGPTVAPSTYNNVNKMMVTSKDIYQFLQGTFSSSAQFTAANAMQDNEDLLYAIEGTTNKMLIRNASELTPCIITVYLLQSKALLSTRYPWECAGLVSDFPSSYIPYASAAPEVSLRDQSTPTSIGQTTIRTDNTARLGFTPQMSPYFNQKFEVVDVFKSPTLSPGDQWDVTTKQHFARPTSYHDLRTLFGATPDFESALYCPGDYEMLIQFQGAPGFANNENLSDSYDKRIATGSNPCMISMTQSRSIQYRFQSSVGGEINASDNYTANVVKEIDIAPRISTYLGDANYNYRAVAMTNTESKVANAAGIGESMDV